LAWGAPKTKSYFPAGVKCASALAFAGMGDASRPKLRLLPPVDVTQAEIAQDSALEQALANNFDECVRALLPAELDDPVGWWVEIAEPLLEKVSERVVLASPGHSPETVAAGAVAKVIEDWLADYDAHARADNLPPSTHPSRLKRLTLIVSASPGSDPDSHLAVHLPAQGDIADLSAHAMALALVIGGAAARVVSGHVSAAKLAELVKMTRPAVVVVEQISPPELIEALKDGFPSIPVIYASEKSIAGRDFRALVTKVLGATE
jgi:hypothetical protein